MDGTMIDSQRPASETAVVLPSDARAPGIAREVVAQHALGLPAEIVEDALVVVSELVTNAVLHGRPEIILRLRRYPPGIGIGVQDGGEQRPQLPSSEPGVHDPAGRGMRIVDALADRWTVESNTPPPGKTVWFELGRPSQ